LSEKNSKIAQFVKSYVESRNAQLTEQSPKVFTVKYPNQTNTVEYTYDAAVAREKESLFIAFGSPAFQHMLRECLENGVLSQVSINPNGNFEAFLNRLFKDSPFSCQDCCKVDLGIQKVWVCQKTQPCFHQINNAKIESYKICKKEPIQLYQFYFSAIFQNKLRPRNEEEIIITVDQNGIVVCDEFFNEKILCDDSIEVKDLNSKLKTGVFEELKAVADKKLDTILKEKVVLFDLSLIPEKKSKLKSFEKRMRRARLEQQISKKADFDSQTWQLNYHALYDREEESFTTHIAVKFTNLLVINTSKITFDVNLDNKASFHSTTTLGINGAPEVICPICKNPFFEGYATADSVYVCGNCVRQSVDSDKIYSKKGPLKLDEPLNEYLEQDAGFVCSVCGKRHSRLLEFKCNFDNSSVCIYHYDQCDACGQVFSKLNLKPNSDFTRKLCPKHAASTKN
jgi:hypothetical protein